MVRVEALESRLPIPTQSYCINCFMRIYKEAAADLNVNSNYEIGRTRKIDG